MPKMKRVVSSAFLVLLQTIVKSVASINAGLVDFKLNTQLMLSSLICPDQLTVPPVTVVNASISQLYNDQVLFNLNYFVWFWWKRS